MRRRPGFGEVDGVVTYQVIGEDSGSQLVDFVSNKLSCSTREARRIIDANGVLVNRRWIWMARHVLSKGDFVEISKPKGEPQIMESQELRVLAETPGCLVVDKPAGIVSNGASWSAESIVQAQRKDDTVKAAHRIDKETSGCLLFAKGSANFQAVVRSFQANKVDKVYLAICFGCPRGEEFTIDSALDEKTAVSHVRRLDSTKTASILEVRIDTGRNHQIRRHLSMVGHPLAGDGLHWKKKTVPDAFVAIPRPMLHAFSLGLPCPTGSGRVDASAEPPADFIKCLKSFGLKWTPS